MDGRRSGMASPFGEADSFDQAGGLGWAGPLVVRQRYGFVK